MPPRLHLVTDDRVLGEADFLPRARAVLSAGREAVALHLRGHGTAAAALYRLAIALAPDVRATGAWLVVNDRVDLALATLRRVPDGRAGVQLGARSIPVAEALRLLGDAAAVGYSAHGTREGVEAEAAGAAYIVFGSVYETASHPGEAPAGIAALQRVVRAVTIPVIAIGGVTPARVPEVLDAGARGIAVLSGVWSGGDPAGSVHRYLEALTGAPPPI